MLKKIISIFCLVGFCVMNANADDMDFIMEADEGIVEENDALLNYQVEGSLFEQITMLEQEKVVAQLEKERAQIDLELERLNAEKMKVQMELDTLSGRAEQQQQELEIAKAQIQAQAENIERQRELLSQKQEIIEEKPVVEKQSVSKAQDSINKMYKLVNVVGAGNQLQATIEDISTGQNKRISVGKVLDGYVVKSISLDEGISFEKDGVVENLNIGK